MPRKNGFNSDKFIRSQTSRIKQGYTLEKLIMIMIILIIGTIILGSINSNDQTQETITFLEQQGFRQVSITGYDPFSCSRDDISSIGFTAINSNGYKVSGTICSGLLKGKTIRYK